MNGALTTAVVVPAFSGAYMLLLQGALPYVYTPAVLIALSGVLVVVGALLGPETRDVELHAVAYRPGGQAPRPQTA